MIDMNTKILTVKYINIKNCFIHLSHQNIPSLIGPTVCGLKITTDAGRELYFSQSSVPCTFLDENYVGISRIFGTAVGLRENENVIVSPLYNLGSVQAIYVTPKSENDYDILQSLATSVEVTLLNQLRIVWPQQVFPVWVSPNISVTLVVDSISPNLKFGRLEEYSEVVVYSVIPKSEIKRRDTDGNDPSIPSSNSREEVIEQKKLIFRCVPQEDLNSPNCKFSLHPYAVFTRRSSLPKGALEVIDSNRKTVWTLSKCEEPHGRCMVNILFTDDALDPEEVPGFRTLFVSNLLKRHLGLCLGEKVSLEFKASGSSSQISGLLISSSLEVKDKLVDELHETLVRAVSAHGDLLLNTKAPYPLGNDNVGITLRPLDATCGFISMTTLTRLSIDINTYVSQNSLTYEASNEVKDEEVIENYLLSFEDLIEEGRSAVELSLGFGCKNKVRRSCDNTIYIGKNGCGKTRLVNCLLERLRGPPNYIYTKRISCGSYKGKRVEGLSKLLSDVLQTCCLHEPSVLFLDDIDYLASISEESTEAAFHMNRISHKIVELIEAYQKKNCIVIIATAKRLDTINPQILSSKGKCLFKTMIKIRNLDKDDRLELIKKSFSTNISTPEENINYDDVAKRTEGYTPLDLKKLCEKAMFEAWQRKGSDNLILTNSDLELAVSESKPLSLYQVNFYKGPKTTWADIGGLKGVKEKLVEVVCWPTMYPHIINQCPVKPQAGVLLYGAPGTGKTLIAGALATESRLNFISVKGPELMSKYIGESEEAVRKLFEKAQAAQPCLLFFDEFDSFAPRRGQDQTGVTDRVVNQLLTVLDGVDPMSGVWVIAATSRPDLIDPAVLRPGRIGISVHCPLPLQEDREEIINSICSKTIISKDIDIKELSVLTDGFTGADIKGLFTAAQIKAIDVLQEQNGVLTASVNSSSDSQPEVVLQPEHIQMAFKEMKPSLSEIERRRYQAIFDQFEHHTPVDISHQKVTHA